MLEILYAVLNPADRYLAEGQYPAKPKLPHILGRDGVGVVRTVGAEVGDAVKTGERYVILRGTREWIERGRWRSRRRWRWNRSCRCRTGGRCRRRRARRWFI